MRRSKTLINLAILALVSTVTWAGDILTLTPQNQNGEPLALIYIHGMQCKPEAYQTAAKVLQDEAGQNGYSTYVAIPEFIFDVPEPLLIDHYVQDSISQLKSQGFSGDNIFLAAHSLGGVMSQKYVKGQSDLVKGQILMGSVLLRDTRSINDQGQTEFDYKTPTLTIAGTKDGLLRVTRAAESFWHQSENINSDQANMFPVLALDGLSHAGFMDSTMIPSYVQSNDLKQEIDEEMGHSQIAKGIVNFFNQVLGKSTEDMSNDTLKPLIDAMMLEGSYNIKQPCYGQSLLNPDDDPKCQQGSKWSAKAQEIMAGDLPEGDKASIKTTDNFHRVYTVTPVHLPQINNKCDSMDQQCDLDSYTVTENIYDALTDFDTGQQEISATEMKAKLMSRQSFQVAAGNSTADFHETDEVGNRCAEINQASLDWALANAGPSAKKRYEEFGKKLVIGDDMGPYNAGPLWIWKYLSFEDNEDKTETVVKSPMMRTPTDYPISAAAGFHYCKLLSPFRAMEWIYIDSLFERDSIKKMSMGETAKGTFQEFVESLMDMFQS